MEKIGYVINSTRTYYEHTLPKLLPTIPEEEKHKFLIVISDFKESSEMIKDGFEYHLTKDHSFGKSSPIHLLEMDEHKYKYYFFIPDTTKLGKDFFKLTDNFNPDAGWDLISAQEHCFMGFGAYSIEFLKSIKEEIMDFKNCNKLEEVKGEYRVFDLAKNVTYYPKYMFAPDEHGYDDIYGTGTKRRIIRLRSIDIWKYSANWGEGDYTDINNNWVTTI